MSFGETVRTKDQVRMLSKRAASKSKTSPLSNFQTPALIDLCAGHITVDAREKD